MHHPVLVIQNLAVAVSPSEVTQGHWRPRGSIEDIRFPIIVQ